MQWMHIAIFIENCIRNIYRIVALGIMVSVQCAQCVIHTHCVSSLPLHRMPRTNATPIYNI